MQNSELLIRSTASLAFLLYVAALGMRTRRPDWSRTAWTAGCGMFLIHVACAFQFAHHWSHAAALEATARQTFAATGFNSGAGLWLNYTVMLVWTADALWWCAARESYEVRPRVVRILVQGFLGFMWFNATVVFGHGPARWLGVAAVILGLRVAAHKIYGKGLS